MGFQSAFNKSFASIAGGIMGVKYNLSQYASEKAKSSQLETIQSKQTGSSISTKKNIEDIITESINKKEKQEDKKNMREVNDGNE